jgi:hypothetical protein
VYDSLSRITRSSGTGEAFRCFHNAICARVSGVAVTWNIDFSLGFFPFWWRRAIRDTQIIMVAAMKYSRMVSKCCRACYGSLRALLLAAVPEPAEVHLKQ